MKVESTLFEGRSVCVSKVSYLTHFMLLLAILLTGSVFLATPASAAEKDSKTAFRKQTTILVATAKYNETVAHLRRLQLDAQGFYWNAQFGTGEMEACSVETTLLLSDETATLEIDPFNTALGTLTEVEVVIEGTLMANAAESQATGSEFMLALNSTLNYQLPGDSEASLPVTNNHKQRTYNEFVAQEGFETSGWNTTLVRKTFSAQLNAFQGSGKIQIPIQAKDLVNFHNAESDITSALKTKVCIIYKYQ